MFGQVEGCGTGFGSRDRLGHGLYGLYGPYGLYGRVGRERERVERRAIRAGCFSRGGGVTEVRGSEGGRLDSGLQAH